MKKVYDFAKYKKKKKKMRLVKIYNEYKFTIAFVLIFAVGLSLWTLISLKAVFIYSILLILAALIINGKKKKSRYSKKPTERARFKKPQW